MHTSHSGFLRNYSLHTVSHFEDPKRAFGSGSSYPLHEQGVLCYPLHRLEEEAAEWESPSAWVLGTLLLKLPEEGIGALVLQYGTGLKLAAAPADVGLQVGDLRGGGVSESVVVVAHRAIAELLHMHTRLSLPQ